MGSVCVVLWRDELQSPVVREKLHSDRCFGGIEWARDITSLTGVDKRSSSAVPHFRV